MQYNVAWLIHNDIMLYAKNKQQFIKMSLLFLSFMGGFVVMRIAWDRDGG